MVQVDFQMKRAFFIAGYPARRCAPMLSTNKLAMQPNYSILVLGKGPDTLEDRDDPLPIGPAPLSIG